MQHLLYIFTMLTIGMLSCQQREQESTAAAGDWIKGTADENIRKIEKQFRGFDMAMVETGYRYQELYWAGQDLNWEYAAYQTEKIRVAIENGLERRPKRAASAEHFLNQVLPEMENSIAARDTAVFNSSFKLLTSNCNACHAREEVPFFRVVQPENRPSPIRK